MKCARRTSRRLAGALGLLSIFGMSAAHAGATFKIDDTKWLSLGAGLRTSFSAIENSAPNGTDWSNDFNLDSARIYINGQVNKYIKFELNTECVFCSNANLRKFAVLDAIAKFEFSPAFNIWAGRLLVPADRAEMSGPYYANTYDFNKTPFYPADYSTKFGTGGAGVYGRDHGVDIWGALTPSNRLTYAIGIFNGLQGGSNQDDNLLYGARVSYNFLNVEKNPGYYTSSTYYGKAGDILTLGLAAQYQKQGAGTQASPANFKGYSMDALFEKPLANNGGVVTLEGEYKVFDTGLSVAALADPTCFCMFDGHAWTVTGLYLFPQKIGIGQFQPYVRYTDVRPSNSADRDEYEVGLNYIIDSHNARVSLFYEHGDIATKGLNYTPAAAGSSVDAIKLGLQLQI